MERELERAMHAWIVATQELLMFPDHALAVRLADEPMIDNVANLAIAVYTYRLRRRDALKSEEKKS